MKNMIITHNRSIQNIPTFPMTSKPSVELYGKLVRRKSSTLQLVQTVAPAGEHRTAIIIPVSLCLTVYVFHINLISYLIFYSTLLHQFLQTTSTSPSTLETPAINNPSLLLYPQKHLT